MAAHTRHRERELITLLEPEISGLGYELVELRFRREQLGMVLRLFIDGKDKNGVEIEDCERVSRHIGPVLDVEDPIPSGYRLEVSSPGIDRPLRTSQHFQDSEGETVKVTLFKALSGRRNFSGVVVGATEQQVEVNVDGNVFALPLEDVDKAQIVPDWSKVLGRGAKN